MTFHAGPVPAGTSLYIPFTTYAGSTGASATCTGLAVTDVEIYKNGSTTQRSSDAGIALLDTDGIDFDGITGLHGFSIDLSDNTDAGFYAVGSWYWVVVSAITVDSQTVTFLAATFRIAPAESITGYPKTDQHALKGDAQSATDLQDFADAGYDPATNKVHGVVLVDTLTTYTSNTPQTGDTYALANGAAGFVAIDTVVDAILDDTGTSGVLLSTTAIGAIWNRLTSSMSVAGSIGKKLADWVVGTIDTYTGNTKQTGDSYAYLGTNVGVNGANLTAADDAVIAAIAALNNPSAAQVAAAVEAAILDEGDATALLAAIAAKVEQFLVNEGDATATIAAIATACNAAIVAGTVGTNAATAATQSTAAAASASAVQAKLPTNAIADQTLLAAAIDAVPTVAEIADGVWDESLAGHAGASSGGLLLTNASDKLNTITGSDGVTLATAQALYAPAKAGDAMTLTTAGSQALIELCFTYDATAAYSTAATGSLVKEIVDNAGGASLSVEDIADAVCDELLADHATTGSVGAALTAAASGGGSGTESDLMVSTTIATLTSQTVFTLTAGSADNDAYNRQLVVITDAATSTQKARGIVSDYVGDTKTLTLTGAPAFEIAAGDSISIIAVGSDVSSTQVLSAVSSAIVSAGITTTVTGMPTFLRVGDARTVANGGAIPVRLYDIDDDSLLFGLGESLFADATITFSLRRAGTDSAEGAEDAAIPCTWVEDGADGYVQIAYDADALDNCDAMDRLKEKDCHRWGIKFQWGTDDPITPIYGNISVLRKIVTTQS